MLTNSYYREFAAIVHRNLTSALPYYDAHFYRNQQGHYPHRVHPAFGCSYDWHSAVNSAWAVLRLQQVFPDDDIVRTAAATLQARLTPSAIAAECDYLADNPHYEQPYGWAWLLALYATAPARVRKTLQPLAGHVRDAMTRYFTDLIEPINHGVHSNTAFAATLSLDALAAAPELDCKSDSLRMLIAQRLHQWYVGRGPWPQQWERSGHDFLSPGLAVVEAMCAHLDAHQLADFLAEFLPGWQEPLECYRVVTTTSRDAKQVHWHGLNLFRAGVLGRLAAQLRTENAAAAEFLQHQAGELFVASISEVTGDNYASTHWLPAFALRADIHLLTS